MLAFQICFLQLGLIQYLSVLDLKNLSDNRPILLKLSSLHPIATHSLRNQTEPKNIALEEKQPQYEWKKYLRKTTQKGLPKKQRR